MRKLITLLMLFMISVLFAQEKQEDFGKKISINGSVDAYYQTYLSASDRLSPPFGTSFVDETGFALGMANIVASYEDNKTGVVVDMVFGPRGDAAIGQNRGEGYEGYYINQLYVYWDVAENTRLTLGRFNTFLGYEVISPLGNFNYSTSYLFSNGPFSHVGLKADFALGDDFSLMLGVMNPTDTNNNTTGGYAVGAQLGYANHFLNLYYDNDEVLGFEIDYTGGFDFSEAFFLGLNAAYQTSNDSGFYGAALYPQWTSSEVFSLGLRGELFGYHQKDVDDLPNVFGLTLTGSYVVENLTIKPEIRLDSWAHNMPYLDADGMASDNLAAFTLAAIYSF
ncbi:outer membrane beta-barrel protein [Mariniflexile ostreae]|uniref:Outer membrane beta-barrel protein n=1 Tax=Mariniflexile ostreae TaxID=1520892 RepID=A0ABV5F9G8_9FLAO